MQGTTAQKIEDCEECEVFVLRCGDAGDISEHSIDSAAKLLLDRDGAYARIVPSLHADGMLAVEDADGRVVWKRIVKAIDRLSG